MSGAKGSEWLDGSNDKVNVVNKLLPLTRKAMSKSKAMA